MSINKTDENIENCESILKKIEKDLNEKDFIDAFKVNALIPINQRVLRKQNEFEKKG